MIKNVESKDEYGGFAIKRHAEGDPPYDVKDSYQRFDFRKALNPMVMGAVGLTSLERMKKKDPGFSRIAVAFQEGAWTISNAFGSDSLYGDCGLFQWSAIEHSGTHGAPDYAKELGSWDYQADGYSIEEVSNYVKVAAKKYGASLAGIAELDKRWIYAKSIYMNMSELMSGAAETAVEQGYTPPSGDELNSRDIVMQALLSMDKKDMKDLLVHTVEIADPAILPDGVSADALKGMPAAMFQKMLPTVLPTFPDSFSCISSPHKLILNYFQLILIQTLF